METQKIKELIKKTIKKISSEEDINGVNEIKKIAIIYSKVLQLCDSNNYLARALMEEAVAECAKEEIGEFNYMLRAIERMKESEKN